MARFSNYKKYDIPLKKYDAPLSIQYMAGYQAFKTPKFYVKKGHVVLASPKMNTHSMQYREWKRGWNDAYFGKDNYYEKLEEERNEARKRS